MRQRLCIAHLLALFLLWLPTARAQESATLLFYRDDGASTNLVHASIKIDGVIVHKIRNVHTWTVQLPTGNYFICGDDPKYGQKYVLESGKTYYFSVQRMVPGNAMTSRPRYRIVAVSNANEAAGFPRE